VFGEASAHGDSVACDIREGECPSVACLQRKDRLLGVVGSCVIDQRPSAPALFSFLCEKQLASAVNSKNDRGASLISRQCPSMLQRGVAAR
jgi:hypothetical protein